MSPETAFVFNTMSYLFHGALVFIMGLGFCLLETGMVQTKNATVQCMKNIGLYAIACLTFMLAGYHLMFSGTEAGFLPGEAALWLALTPDTIDVNGNYVGTGNTDVAPAANWFFQMVFVGATASIVSGAVAERVNMIAFFVFVVALAGLIYPIVGAWTWGNGWLAHMDFVDFAGSTIVHSVGGWAALTGILIIGPRIGKYRRDGKARPFLASNIPLVTAGTFLLWFGWLGFNGGSQLAFGSAVDALAVARIYANTNTAAAAAVVAVVVLNYARFRKIDLTVVLNGSLGGLVAITASPLEPTPLLAAGIGVVAGILVNYAIPMMDRLQLDDVVGAVPVHLVCGIWGTIAVVFSHKGEATMLGQLLIQLTGIAAVGVFVVVTTTIAWLVLRFTIGIRVSHEAEYTGLDMYECGAESYPEFTAAGREQT